MVREIVKDETFLAQKSVAATIEDKQIAIDLLDTLAANKGKCVGLAANMIGELKNIIVFYNGDTPTVMFNAKIIETAGKYLVEEGCLSLEGMRKTSRYQSIKVRYKDMDFKSQVRSFTEFTAEIIQHELDHVSGKVI
ncbi:MAG: peptide deformylase [Bacillota bacterium]|nr:peptide deformylase [Bacillota bacterium]